MLACLGNDGAWVSPIFVHPKERSRGRSCEGVCRGIAAEPADGRTECAVAEWGAAEDEEEALAAS